MPATKKVPTTRELIAQKQQAVATPNKVAVSDDDSRRKAWLDEVAPAAIPADWSGSPRTAPSSPTTTAGDPGGRRVRRDRRRDPGRLDEVQWRERAAGQIMGLLYGGFIMPGVETLPDRDQASGSPAYDGSPRTRGNHWIPRAAEYRDRRVVHVRHLLTDRRSRRWHPAATLRPHSRDAPGELPVVWLRTSGFSSRRRASAG